MIYCLFCNQEIFIDTRITIVISEWCLLHTLKCYSGLLLDDSSEISLKMWSWRDEITYSAKILTWLLFCSRGKKFLDNVELERWINIFCKDSDIITVLLDQKIHPLPIPLVVRKLVSCWLYVILTFVFPVHGQLPMEILVVYSEWDQLIRLIFAPD